MKIAEFNCSVAKQCSSVIIIGGGPSTTSNLNTILEYANKHKSLIYAANYKYPQIDAYYTYLGNGERFLLSIKDIESPFIIINPWTRRQIKHWLLKKHNKKQASLLFKKTWGEAQKKHGFYIMGRGDARNNRHLKKWSARKDGSFNFFPSPAGFSTLVLASCSRPQEVLIAGLDGPENPRPGQKLYKRKFTGGIRAYRSWDAYKYKKRTLEKLALPYLKRRGINLLSFSDCPLWGIDKKKLEIKDIK